MATKTKNVRVSTGTKATVLRLAKTVGGLFASGVSIMIFTGTATVMTMIATAVAGAAFAALVFAATRLDD